MSDLRDRLDKLSPEKRELLLRRLNANAARPSVERIPRRAARRVAPMSSAQTRLWFAAQVDPAMAANNNLAAFRIRGALDADAIEAACQDLVRRHDAFRTWFREREDVREQCIDEGGAVPV